MVAINKHIASIQFITHPSETMDWEKQVMLAAENGPSWIQLRAKNLSPKEFLPIARKLAFICKKHHIQLIINDHVDIALAVDADGVHLGKEDMSPMEARQILGDNKIIGGTANTLEDIIKLYHAGVDYIGLGPFRFTYTKQKLSPILGLEGYTTIFQLMQEMGIDIPVVAVGGIQLSDLEPLKKTGINGIAVSSLILQSQNPTSTINEIKMFFSPLNHPENERQ